MARQVPTMTEMDRLLCAGRAHYGGVAVDGATAEETLAEGEMQLSPGVVRLTTSMRSVTVPCLTAGSWGTERGFRLFSALSVSFTRLKGLWWHICTTHFFSSLSLGGYWFV
jgi:hypothetical protein